MKTKHILLLLLLLLPLSVKAASISITCDESEVTPDTEISCKIKANDEYTSGATGSISVENGSIESFKKNNCVIGEVSNSSFECIGDMKANSNLIITYKIKVDSVGKTIIKINNATIIDKNWNNPSVSNTQVEITVKEEDPEDDPDDDYEDDDDYNDDYDDYFDDDDYYDDNDDDYYDDDYDDDDNDGYFEFDDDDDYFYFDGYFDYDDDCDEDDEDCYYDDDDDYCDEDDEDCYYDDDDYCDEDDEDCNADNSKKQSSNKKNKKEHHGIKSLTIEGIDFKFQENKYEYVIDYKGSLKKAIFNYTTYSKDDVVNISNNELKNGTNSIVVEFVYKDQSVKYFITINKNPNLILSLVLLASCVVLVLASLIFYKKHKN